MPTLLQATWGAVVRMHQSGQTVKQIINALSAKNLSRRQVEYTIQVHGKAPSGASFKNRP